MSCGYSIPQFVWTERKNTTSQQETIKLFRLGTNHEFGMALKVLLTVTMKTAILWDATIRT
jgi:hypothetical protein